MLTLAYIRADHGDAEWVKLIGLAIFAIISLVASAIKKASEARRAAGKTKKLPDIATPPVLQSKSRKEMQKAKSAPRKQPKPLRTVQTPPLPVSKVQKPRSVLQIDPEPTKTAVAPLPARRRSILGSATLRDAVVLSEIISPPIALRRNHLESLGSIE